jgi:hypothetical protein
VGNSNPPSGIAEILAKINPTEPLRLVKQAAHRKRHWSDSSDAQSPTMSMQGKQTQTVIEQETRGVLNRVHGKRYEHDRIRLILVQLVVMEYFLPGCIFHSAIRLRGGIGGNSVRE